MRSRGSNWEAQLSQVIKALKSTFALVLSGTPLENRLDELYSVVELSMMASRACLSVLQSVPGGG